eukprot:Sspe_Gene.25594::Locus_10326_Transcript_1_1_Confidence_1.000_Length_4121::g.25594::m.25594/K19511/PXDN, VPO1; peroxidase
MWVLALLLLCPYGRSEGFRPYNGLGNNKANPTWGSAGEDFDRDGLSKSIFTSLPSPRRVSNAMRKLTMNAVEPKRKSDMHTSFGVFLDHDVTLTRGGGERADIPIPRCDEIFDPYCTGEKTMKFTRSYRTGEDEQVNEATSFIDGSHIYGTSEEVARKLRAFTKGKLRVDEKGFMPLNQDTKGDPILPMAAFGHTPQSELRVCGDKRCNTFPQLLSLHLVWVREHNRLCDAFAAKHPEWDDETLFQTARKWVGAMLQRITYREYLPSLLGEPLPPYTGYNESETPRILNHFAAAIFRYGHSEVGDVVMRLDEKWVEHEYGHLLLKDVFYDSSRALEAGVEPLLRGMIAKAQLEADAVSSDTITNNLFCEYGHCLDLIALDIMRGRDHSLPTLNEVRARYGLRKHASFEELSSNPAVAEALENLYEDIDRVELFPGMLAEDRYKDALGETMNVVIKHQFLRLRNGDRHWYEAPGQFSPEEVAEINNVRLSHVIQRTTDITNLPENVFFTPQAQTDWKKESSKTTSFPAEQKLGEELVLEKGKVQLQWSVAGEHVNILLQVVGTGWVGIGFSPMYPEESLMKNVDMVVGRMQRGIGMVNDMWSKSIGLPESDVNLQCTDDVEEATLSRVNGVTSLRFKRPIESSDGHCDRPLFKTTRIIYAFGLTDDLTYHGPRRGTAQILLFPDEGAENHTVVYIVCPIVGVLVLAVLLYGVVVRRRARMATKIYSDVALTEKCVEAIADMNLEEVAFLETLKSPTPLQTSLQKICIIMKELRAYLPQSLLVSLAPATHAPVDMMKVIVCTDIEGSTSLWQNHPDEMNTALEIHNTVIRRVAECEGGYEVKTVGDAFVLAFSESVAAVRCSLKIQLGLASEEWPDLGFPPRVSGMCHAGLMVRIGIHRGNVQCERNPLTCRYDFRGPTVSKASRVESKAKGGTICISEVVHLDIISSLDALERPSIVDMGEHVIKELNWKTRLYLVAPFKLDRVSQNNLKSMSNVPSTPMTPESRVSSTAETISRAFAIVKVSNVAIVVVKIRQAEENTAKALRTCHIMLCSASVQVSNTKGALENLCGSSLVVSWNASKPCRHPAAGAVQFSISQDRVRTEKGLDIVLGAASGHCSVSHVGTRQKFHMITGPALSCAQMAAYLAEEEDNKLFFIEGNEDPEVCSMDNLQLIDVWEWNSRRLRVFEVSATDGTYSSIFKDTPEKQGEGYAKANERLIQALKGDKAAYDSMKDDNCYGRHIMDSLAFIHETGIRPGYLRRAVYYPYQRECASLTDEFTAKSGLTPQKVTFNADNKSSGSSSEASTFVDEDFDEISVSPELSTSSLIHFLLPNSQDDA